MKKLRSKLFASAIIILIIQAFLNVVSAQSDTFEKPEPFDIGSAFIPSLRMGCYNEINVDPVYRSEPNSEPFCYKITYIQPCSLKWAGIYWVNDDREDGPNDGKYPGTDLSDGGFTKITFYAKGENGGEWVEFGAFGIDNTRKNPDVYKYKDKCPKTFIKNRKVLLEKEWKQYTINLKCKDLSSVIGGFYWAASSDAHPSGLVFYLDDIQFE
ncbi:MAG: hypothetical protein J5I94_05055 [Phaeodactylibacter sp.]|nr:hypothetical protein [Phaeodactylibacter sp.]